MRTSEPRVLWTDGLFLEPTHLQQSDRYHESHLASRLDALSPINWGVVRLEIDRHALSTGVLRLAELAAVLPDGSTVAIGADSPEAPPSRPVEGFTAERPAVEVWLGLPRERDGVLQVGERARYRKHTRRMSDAFSAEVEPSDVELAHRNLRLLLGHEPREDYDAVKIAEVRRDSHGAYVLDETFIPPCLQLGGSDVLCAALERLIARMETRRRALLDARRERDADTVEADATDITRFVLLHTISQALPALHHIAKARDVSPRALHFRLLDLLGSLSTFAVDANLEAPLFDHTDLRATFTPLFARLERLLSQSHRESCFVVELQPREDGMHFLQLEEQVARCERFLLSVRTELPSKQTADLVPTTSKVASWGQINGVVASALPGARLAIEHRPPPEVPVRAGDVYFAVDVTTPYWADVVAQKNLAVFMPRPFDATRTRVQLVAIPPRGSKPAQQSGVRPPPPPPRTSRS